MMGTSFPRSRSFARARQHLALFAIAAALTGGMFVVVRSDHLPFRLSMATAYASMTFLVAVILIGPIRVLQGRPNPVSTDLRRDIGIWGGILGLLHVVAGLQVHFTGKMWQYFIYPRDQWSVMPIRFDPFGLANYAGAVAALILILLLSLSNDASLRRLRPPRWKMLQRANYVGMALIIAHGFAYQLLEERQLVFVMLFVLLVLVAVRWQLAGYRKTLEENRNRATRRGPPESE